MSTLGDRIRAGRAHRGLSQEELADKVGTTRSSVSLWEGGREPAPSTLAHIVRVLNVDGDWLLTGDGVMERGRRGVEALRLQAIANIATGAVSDAAIRRLARPPGDDDPDLSAAHAALEPE